MDVRVALAGKIAGQRVAYGLDWRLLDDQAPNQRLRTEAAMRHSRHGVLIPATDQQSRPVVLGGILPMGSDSSTNAAYSAAAWLALMHPTSRFVLAHDLGDGRYWVIRIDNGFFDPNSDVVLDERTASDSIFEMVTAKGDSDQVPLLYTGRRPKLRQLATGVIEAREHSIEDITGPTPPKLARLRQIRGMTVMHWLLIFAGAAMLMAIGGGMLWWKQNEERKQVEAAAADLALREQQEQELKTLHDVRQRTAVLDQLALDTATASPDGMIHACILRVKSIDLRLGGWEVVDVDCNLQSGQLTARYQLPDGATGTSESLVAAATASGMTANPALGTNQADVTTAFGQPLPRPALVPDQLPSGGALSTTFASRFQLANQSSIRSTIGAPADRVVMYADPSVAMGSAPAFLPVPSDRGYREGVLTLTGEDLWQIDQVSLNYPFVGATKLTLRPSDSTMPWTIEGKYYASPN